MVTRPREIEPEALERIVREVTRRLREMPEFASSFADSAASIPSDETNAEVSAPTTGLAPSPTSVPAATGVVRLAALVVTLAEVTGRLEGAREVVIGPRAILTPAVRDLLIQRRIALTRTAAETRVASGPAILLVAGWAMIGHEPERYWQQLERLGMETRQVDGSSLPDILQEMATRLAGGACQGMLLTDQTAATLCLANRHPGVRAILATGVNTVRGDIEAVGANLLVVSPRGLTAYQLGSLAREFCQAGARPCPENYRKWLS